ncbi:phospholipid scramblase 2 [Pieris rapae]|uniref:phospholipid scramblase 2 n=1 Tax=Pieris rapae TaxID=64459 RepID=UPI001E27D964|nr:phospholipid scramblase 2 [Pieris rapae]
MASDIVRGRDNPSVTQDDGSYLRTSSERIISNQPHSNNNRNSHPRAQLSVSTEAWNTRNVSPLRPRHGLDFLTGVSTLNIQQTVDISHLTSNIKSENLYTIKIPNGLTLYLASETSTKTQRLLCGVGRAFTMQIHDNTRQNVMQMERRLAAASCCFPCRLQEMQVITPPGDYIGRVQQQWTWVVPFYLVRNVNDEVIYVIEGPSSIDNRNMILGHFKILSSDFLREVGKISHRWEGDVNSFVTAIDFPLCASDPKQKALLLAATFLLEYTYFERAKTSCLRFNCC